MKEINTNTNNVKGKIQLFHRRGTEAIKTCRRKILESFRGKLKWLEQNRTGKQSFKLKTIVFLNAKNVPEFSYFNGYLINIGSVCPQVWCTYCEKW